jgi:integrase
MRRTDSLSFVSLREAIDSLSMIQLGRPRVLAGMLLRRFPVEMGSEAVISASRNRHLYLKSRPGVVKVTGFFAADTRSGHVETGTLKKQHAKTITASEVRTFVAYDLRHTCLQRWAKVMIRSRSTNSRAKRICTPQWDTFT